MLLPLILTLIPIPPLLAALVYAAIALVDQCKRTSQPFLVPVCVPSLDVPRRGYFVPAGLLHVYRLADMQRGCAAPPEERVWP